MEQPLGFEPGPQPLQLQVTLPQTLRLHHVNVELKVPAHLIKGNAAVCDNRTAVAQVFAASGGTEHDALELAGGVLESEVSSGLPPS